MKKAAFPLVFALFLALAGCVDKNSEILRFIADSDNLTGKIVGKIRESPNAEGVAAAQRLLDAEKRDLRAEYESLTAVRGSEVREETMKKFTESVFRNAEAINGMRRDFHDQIISDDDFAEKLDKLIDDFNGIYEV